MSVCTFQPGNFTGWGSDGVKQRVYCYFMFARLSLWAFRHKASNSPLHYNILSLPDSCRFCMVLFLLHSPYSLVLNKRQDILTPSLPQPVEFPGWKVHGRTCKQYFSGPITHLLSLSTFWCKSFHIPAQKRRQKGLRISRFALLLAIFKWHHGSEVVNGKYNYKNRR